MSNPPSSPPRTLQARIDEGESRSTPFETEPAPGDGMHPNEDWAWVKGQPRESDENLVSVQAPVPLPTDYPESRRSPATFVDTPEAVAAMVNTIVTASKLSPEVLREPHRCHGPAWSLTLDTNQAGDDEDGNPSSKNDQPKTLTRAAQMLRMKRAGRNLVKSRCLSQKTYSKRKTQALKKKKRAAERSAAAALADVSDNSFALHIDIEGTDLSRYGSISIVQIFLAGLNHTYLVDVYKLHDLAFTTRGRRRVTLYDILQSPRIPKVLFDVRNDSDALYAHFSIAMEGVQDIQLMQMACRENVQSRGGYLAGLAKCLMNDVQSLDQTQRKSLKAVKDRGRELLNGWPNLELFNGRPLRVDLWNYCAQDVTLLPELRTLYWNKLTPAWRRVVLEESAYRTKASQECWYNPDGPQKKWSPWLDETLDNLRDGSIVTPAKPVEDRYPPQARPYSDHLADWVF